MEVKLNKFCRVHTLSIVTSFEMSSLSKNLIGMQRCFQVSIPDCPVLSRHGRPSNEFREDIYAVASTTEGQSVEL
jgi:hypothetical protein